MNTIKDTTKPYIIGETAYIHEGDINYLLRMVDDIARIGLNAVKFHVLLNPESYYQKNHPRMEILRKRIFSQKQWDCIFDYSRKKKLEVIALCDDVESVKYIITEKKKVLAIEIHATSLNDYYLLDAASEFNGFIILGIGGSEIDEIKYAVYFLKKKNAREIILMYGFQNYPTAYRDINLSKMIKLRDIFKLQIGYADHSAFDNPFNEIISIMAATIGFHILEKHYTLHCGVKRTDYEASVGKESMKRIKELMQIALEVYGNGKFDMSTAELNYGRVGPMKKAIVARRAIIKGEKLNMDSLWFKRTTAESPIKQNQILELIGLEAVQNIEEDDILDFSKFKKPSEK